MNNENGQDASSIGTDLSERFVFAITCDGISACSEAEIASKGVARILNEELVRLLEQGTPEQIDWKHLSKVVSHRFRLEYLPQARIIASNYPYDFKLAEGKTVDVEILFRTTAEIVIVESGTRNLWFTRLAGDGTLFEIASSSRLLTPMEMLKREELNHDEVDYLPNWSLSPQVFRKKIEGSALILATDGFSESIMDSDAMKQYCWELSEAPFATLMHLDQLLNEAAKVTGDDLSFVIIKLR